MRAIDMAGVQAAPGRPPLGKEDASEAKNAFGDFLDRDASSGRANGAAMRDMAGEAALRSAHPAEEKVEEFIPMAASNRLNPERSGRNSSDEAGREVSNAAARPASGSDAAGHDDMRIQPAGRARIDWLALTMPKGEDAPAAEPAEPTVEDAEPAPPADDALPTASQKVAEAVPDARLAASGLRRDERAMDDRERPSIRTEASRGSAADAPPRLSMSQTPANSTETAAPTPRDPAARDAAARSTNAPLPARQPFASTSAEQAPDMSARPVATLSVQTVPAFAAGLQGPSQTVLGAIRDEVPELARPAAAIAGQPRTAEPMRVLKIQLHPLELGVVTARLSLQGGEMRVELQTETREAASRLAVDSNEIAKALRGLGIEIDRVTVTQQPSGNMQPHGQQAGSERSGERFANEGDAGGRQSGQRGADNGAGGFEGERNAGDSQGSRGVYI
ncbi:flagellar hook-length control protein FliK [Mesorhizobium sp. YIM 152430]|uniref:flagellar hook-length control protein FliK n=1 Tax=Mesorhizobium sp. YIM 152430 TaxID=3031761 RepID=UPI0023DA662B|nr:flagellar hook-length control protein FliK [Mesorhizobium sp. YIM 152430]MDF1601666.1 flagellar hook-length control protein FliK [Mesorhizobium sp. YIM 152430]